MRKDFFSFIILILSLIASINGQNLGIGPDTFDPDASAGVEIRFTNKGLLIPRVALTSATSGSPITSPATSLLVYNTGTGGLIPAGYYYNSGTPASPVWVRFATTGLDGSGAATRVAFWSAANTLSSNADLYWDNTNNRLGVGTSAPGSKLDVNGVIKAHGNYYNVLSWNYNGTPTNGVKIKTNLPFSDHSQMPTIIIEGYDYGSGNPIGISIVWYIYGGNFYSFKASSWGNTTPTIKLANEGGLVTIWLDWRPYYGRFNVRVYAKGMSETASWLDGWTVVDEVAGTTNQVTVPYSNTFPGIVNFANGIWNSNGYVGIGTTSPQAQLHTTGSVRFANYPSGANGAIVRTDASGNLAITNFTGNTSQVLLGNGTFGAITAAGGVTSTCGTANYVPKMNSSTQMSCSQIFDDGTNVGIGTASPANKLDVNGNTRTTGKFFGHLNVDDTRSVNDAPTSFNNEVAFEFKSRGTVGVPGSGTYSGQITLAPWGDNSGNASHQINFNEGGIYWRQGQPDATSWGPWTQILTSNIAPIGNGTTNYVSKWTSSTTLGNSQIFDDGTNVGIGTTSPSEKLHINGSIRGNQSGALRISTGSGYIDVGPQNTSWAHFYTDRANYWFDKSIYLNSGILSSYSSSNLYLQTNGTTRIIVDNSSGYVGIGGTPTYNLDVIGDVRLSGDLLYGNGNTRTQTRDDAGAMGGRSGFYETSAPSPAANWPTGASSWWHLLDIRHSNTGNNYAMQFAGSFFDQKLYFRKTNNNAAQAWSQIYTSLDGGIITCSNANYVIKSNGTNGVCSQIYDNGTSVGIGTTTPQTRLHVSGSALLDDGFEDGTLSPFTTGGNANWTVSTTSPYAGSYCAESGTIAASQSTYIQLTQSLTSPGKISFAFKVSSESCCDKLSFYIDGTLINSWGGEVAWGIASFPVSSGSHTFKWEYSKDGSVNSGSDKAWIDNIKIYYLSNLVTIDGNTEIGGNTNIGGNTIVSGNVGIGTTSPSYKLHINSNSTSENYLAYVYRPSGSYGPGKASIYGYRRGTSGDTCGGTGYTYSTTDDATLGYSWYGNNYTFGVHGCNWNDYNRCGGVLGSVYTGSYWASLGYKNSANNTFGVYYTNNGSGSGYSSIGGAMAGVGAGGYGDMLGVWSRGEVMGAIFSGELFSTYNLGNTYTSGTQVELVKTNNEKTPAYTMTSTKVKIYADGLGYLSGTEIFISYDNNFKKLLGDTTPIITITPIGKSANLYIKSIDKDGFIVACDTPQDIQFSWIAVGTRIDNKEVQRVPEELTDINFDNNLVDFMFNENIKERSAKAMWWDGSRIQFGKLPEFFYQADREAKQAELEKMKQLEENNNIKIDTEKKSK